MVWKDMEVIWVVLLVFVCVLWWSELRLSWLIFSFRGLFVVVFGLSYIVWRCLILLLRSVSWVLFGFLEVWMFERWVVIIIFLVSLEEWRFFKLDRLEWGGCFRMFCICFNYLMVWVWFFVVVWLVIVERIIRLFLLVFSRYLVFWVCLV